MSVKKPKKYLSIILLAMAIMAGGKQMVHAEEITEAMDTEAESMQTMNAETVAPETWDESEALIEAYSEPVYSGFVEDEYGNVIYYYPVSNQMIKGEKCIKGYWYYFDEVTGVMATDFTVHHDQWYYYDTEGRMQYGNKNINGKSYYFDPVTGVMQRNIERVRNGHWVYYGNDGAMVTGWAEHHGNTYYYNSKGWMLYGRQTIDGKQYIFDSVTGVMQKNIERVEGGHWVYYGSDGAKATGWTEHHGNTYYYNSKGWMVYGSQTIDGKKYVFDSVTGALMKNVEKVEGGHWVYYGNDGLKAIGWTEHHGNTYYYNEKGWMLYGSQTIDGKKYTFDSVTGALMKNVEKVEGGHWVYYGNDGAMVTGWAEHHGNTYYYNSKGWMLYGSQTINGKKYYFDPVTGVMYRGEKVVNGHWAYYDETTGAMAIGWTEHHGNRYYYNASGYMVYGRQKIDGKQWDFNPITGALLYGFYTSNGNVYYRDKNYNMLYGQQEIDGKIAVFDEKTGALQLGLKTIEGKTYYYTKEKPYIYTGEIYLSGKWRYFDEKTGVMAKGWAEHHGNRYYYDEEGGMVYGWKDIEEKTYYFDSVTGVMAKGEKIIDGNPYYFDIDTGEKLTSGWTWVDGYKRYINQYGQIDNDVSRLVSGPYLVKVYKWSNYLIVYAQDEWGNYTVPVKSMIVSCGYATPTGTFYTPAKFRWLTMLGGCQGQWCTQIYGDFLFHSVPYMSRNNTTLYTDAMYNYLGNIASHGCIRLQAGDAKWIYDNCGLGTAVVITGSESSGPIDKPGFTPLPSWHTWDPTDPTAYYLCQQRGCH